jgi:hypothetical protein
MEGTSRDTSGAACIDRLDPALFVDRAGAFCDEISSSSSPEE